MIPAQDPERTYVAYAILLFAYSLVCFTTMFYLGSTVSRPISSKAFADDTTLGPLNVARKNTVYEITVKEDLPLQGSAGEVWNSITVSLLDANREFLMGWNDEVWAAAGRDSEGAWRESRSRISAKITIPEKGAHYLRFQSEGNIAELPQLTVLVVEKVGSTPAFTWLGSLSMIGSLGFWYYGKKELFEE
jgi:hypothetical protein